MALILAWLALAPVLIISASGQHLLLAGGGLQKDSDFFWSRLVQLGGGKERAKIGLITSGREDPEASAKSLTNILNEYGALVTWINIGEDVNDDSNDPFIASQIMKQSAIFLDDGDPHRLINSLRYSNGTDSLVLSALRDRFRRGIISGSGAGAAVLSGNVIPLTGHSYETLIHGTRAYVENPGRRQGKRFHGCQYLAKGGLGFLRNWLIEPRFNDESLHGRTIRLLLDARDNDQSPALGLGIDKEMALAIYRVGREDEFAEVLGNKGGITIVNATAAEYQTTPELKISGVSLTFLSEDDKLILATDEILPASWKADLTGEEWHVLAKPSSDIFASHTNPDHRPGEFNRMAKRLYDSALMKRVSSVSWQDSPKLIVEMDRRSGYAFHNDSPTTSHHCISYSNLHVKISIAQPV